MQVRFMSEPARTKSSGPDSISALDTVTKYLTWDSLNILIPKYKVQKANSAEKKRIMYDSHLTVHVGA